MTLPLPFGPGGPEGVEVWTVSDLNSAMRALIEQNAAPVWIKGEVTSYKSYSSGHWYFTLQDKNAQVKCVMWRTWTQRARTRPEQGAEVYLFGSPGLWEEKGEFRFNAQVLLRSDQLGAQQTELERARAALTRDGLLDAARKRALPRFPRRVVIITSLEGAAVRDIVAVARSRWAAVRLVVIGTRVQGPDAVSDLMRALRAVHRTGADICIVGRGGGAREDLSAFNDERVCRALAAVGIPTISAVGHENDVTLCDLVADLRAATPSNAAELAIPDKREFAAHVDNLGRRLAGGLTRRTRLVHERLGRTGDRLESAMGSRLRQVRHELDQAAGKLDALSPLRVLERGYAVAMAADGRVVRSARALPPGSPFTLRLRDGSVPARAEEHHG